MKVRNRCFSALAILGVVLFAGHSTVARIPRQDPQQPPPDNTKTNQRDKSQTSPTADQQKMNSADREITKKIRTAVHNDNSLSTYAHNIKIVTQNGKVTLKGPVRSEDEKNNIGAKAGAVAGESNVDNQLDVVPQKQ